MSMQNIVLLFIVSLYYIIFRIIFIWILISFLVNINSKILLKTVKLILFSTELLGRFTRESLLELHTSTEIHHYNVIENISNPHSIWGALNPCIKLFSSHYWALSLDNHPLASLPKITIPFFQTYITTEKVFFL